MSFWQFIAIFMTGFSGGFLVGVLVDKDTVYKGVFKIKQRGRGNVQSTTVKPEIPPKTKRDDRKDKRKEKRDGRKTIRKARRAGK